MRRHGVAGTGIAAITEHSQVSRRTVYNTFPDGKTELVRQAAQVAGGVFIGDQIARALELPTPPQQSLIAFISQWKEVVAGSDFAAGCPHRRRGRGAILRTRDRRHRRRDLHPVATGNQRLAAPSRPPHHDRATAVQHRARRSRGCRHHGHRPTIAHAAGRRPQSTRRPASPPFTPPLVTRRHTVTVAPATPLVIDCPAGTSPRYPSTTSGAEHTEPVTFPTFLGHEPSPRTTPI